MEHAVIPAPRLGPEFGIFANHVEQRLDGAQGQRFRVLRHKEHMAALLASNFIGELTETLGARQINRAARLASVPVAAGNKQALPAIGERDYPMILLATAGSVQLKRVQESNVFFQETIHHRKELPAS